MCRVLISTFPLTLFLLHLSFCFYRVLVLEIRLFAILLYRVATEIAKFNSRTFLSHFSGLFEGKSLLSLLASHWVSGFTILYRQSTGKTF